jgi:hypothetical protein
LFERVVQGVVAHNANWLTVNCFQGTWCFLIGLLAITSFKADSTEAVENRLVRSKATAATTITAGRFEKRA